MMVLVIRCLSCRMGQTPLKRQVAIPHISEWDFTAAEFYVKNMVADGATDFTECGPGAVLQGLIKKIDGTVSAHGIA